MRVVVPGNLLRSSRLMAFPLALRLLENLQFLLRAIERNGQTLAFVSKDLAMDATFVLMALRPGDDIT